MYLIIYRLLKMKILQNKNYLQFFRKELPSGVITKYNRALHSGLIKVFLQGHPFPSNPSQVIH